MKLRELIEIIDKSSANRENVDISCLASRVFDNHDIPWVEQDRLVAYWLSCWYCTDTWVGIQAYFLDDEFVALSTKLARKSDTTFDWVSTDAFHKVKDFVESFAEDQSLKISILNAEEEFGDGYRVSYNTQILSHLKATLDGQPVKVVRSKEQDYHDFCSAEVVIDKKQQKVDVARLLFSYMVVSEDSGTGDC